MQTIERFPIWFIVINCLLIILHLFIFGIFSWYNPELPWPHLGDGPAKMTIYYFAIRHIAIGIPLIHGLLKKDATILRTIYMILLIIAVLDIGLIAMGNYYIPVIVNLIGVTMLPVSFLIICFIFILPVVVCLRYLKNNAASE